MPRCSRGRSSQITLGKEPVHAEPSLVVFGIRGKLVIVALDVSFSIIFDRSNDECKT